MSASKRTGGAECTWITTEKRVELVVSLEASSAVTRPQLSSGNALVSNILQLFHVSQHVFSLSSAFACCNFKLLLKVLDEHLLLIQPFFILRFFLPHLDEESFLFNILFLEHEQLLLKLELHLICCYNIGLTKMTGSIVLAGNRLKVAHRALNIRFLSKRIALKFLYLCFEYPIFGFKLANLLILLALLLVCCLILDMSDIILNDAHFLDELPLLVELLFCLVKFLLLLLKLILQCLVFILHLKRGEVVVVVIGSCSLRSVTWLPVAADAFLLDWAVALTSCDLIPAELGFGGLFFDALDGDHVLGIGRVLPSCIWRPLLVLVWVLNHVLGMPSDVVAGYTVIHTSSCPLSSTS